MNTLRSARRVFLVVATIPLFMLAACSEEASKSFKPSQSESAQEPEPTTQGAQPTKATASQSAPSPTEQVDRVGYHCGDPHLHKTGTTSFDDGTSAWTQACADKMMAEYTPHATPSAEEEDPDLSTIPLANGGTCAAAICGYGTDENGNPNPSSGELQTMHGCEDGYVTDENLCAAVQEKADQYGW